MERLEKDFPIVKVVWHDAVSYDPWESITEVNHEPARIVTVGFLLKDDGNVTVAQTLDTSNEKCCLVMVIPAGWIESISIL